MKRTNKPHVKWKIVITVVVLAIFLIFLIAYELKPKVEDYEEKNIETAEDELTFIVNNLVGGGPRKDGIPAIDRPKYVSASEATIDDSQKIFGVNYNGFVAAYPQNIMYWHEIVNEEVNGKKISVTYCPLTESIIGYKDKNLGVSGELYNSNLVMYDRESDARIPQILGKAVEGTIKGETLETFEIVVTTWGEWKKKNPNSLVLTEDTGNPMKLFPASIPRTKSLVFS